MAITLLELRTFCAEIASPDSAGSTHDREAMVWINNALQRLYSDADWDESLHSRLLTVLPQETGTTGILTQGSLAFAVTVAETIETKYVDDEWEFIIGTEADQTFVLASRTDAQNATFRAGDEWILASDTGVAWTALKTKYPLPNDAREITRVQLMSTGHDLEYLPNHTYDYRKSQQPTQTGQPEYFTLRDRSIEIWPHPGASYEKLGISYRKGPTFLEDADLDATVIEWPENQKDLLLKAITLEASITQGNNSPTPYQIALVEYESRLRKYRGLNSNKAHQTGPMSLRLPGRMPWYEVSRERDISIPDVGPA